MKGIRFRQLKKCRFMDIKNGYIFWHGPPDAGGMADLVEYRRVFVRVVTIDQTYPNIDEWCYAGAIGTDFYPFSPCDQVYAIDSSLKSET